MKLSEIINKLDLKVYTENKDFDVEVAKGYASDLLSDVMANAHPEGLWITLQIHQNIVAVAVLKSLSAIILINNREPDDDTVKKANEEGINILSSELSMFEMVGKLYGMGISGSWETIKWAAPDEFMEYILKCYKADLHIHTCLSPCAELEMTPQKIISQALKKGLDIIAVTDHNTAENIPAVLSAAKDHDICVVPGMEVTSSEEVHVIALFENLDSILSFQNLIYENLQEGENNDELFGMQVVANDKDEVEYLNKRLLILATHLSFDRVIKEIKNHEGLAIAAHIDRETYSVISQLGFIPPDQELDALEISRRMSMDRAKIKFKEYDRFPFVTSSDSHVLDTIGIVTTDFNLESPSFEEIKMALKNQKKRKIIYK